ncbi:MAG: phosphopantothenate/pantothenate synthetase [Promethearchaeota archaeon]
MKNIPENHPRANSLRERHKIIDGMTKLIVAKAGLIAHGRGEAFDYLIGEKTNKNAINAMETAVAELLCAKHPIISVNGNVTALCSEELVKFSNIIEAPLEINLFYRMPGRIESITKALKKAGAKRLLGTIEKTKTTINKLSSNRRFVDPNGIKIADVVLIPLEDGDRTESLVKEGKTVITIDLNPLSRTAQWAHITIVDNIIRVLPKLTEITLKYKQNLKENKISKSNLREKTHSFNNKKNLSKAIRIIKNYLVKLSKKGVFIQFKKD